MMKIQDWLTTWFAERSDGSAPKPEDNFFEAEVIDSFEIITLIEEIEETYLIQFTNEDFQDRRFSSIKGLSEIVKEKLL